MIPFFLSNNSNRNCGSISLTGAVSAILTGLIFCFCCITVAEWHTDNDYPDLYPHRTLVQWIYVNQIQVVNKALHELW